MTLTFQKEPFIGIMHELPPLMLEHWKETYEEKERLPFDPNLSRYAELSLVGIVHVMTARYAGKLVGYYIAIVSPNLHSRQALTAWSDMFYMHPDFREEGHGLLGGGYKLLAEANKMVQALGVRKSYIVTKIHSPIRIILRRLKYFLVEEVHARMF